MAGRDMCLYVGYLSPANKKACNQSFIYNPQVYRSRRPPKMTAKDACMLSRKICLYVGIFPVSRSLGPILSIPHVWKRKGVQDD